MNQFVRIRMAIAAVAAFLALSTPAAAWACSVCQGDPDSKLVKGAESGVLLMVLVTYSVLLAFAGFAALWFVRSRRMSPPIAPRPCVPRTLAPGLDRPSSDHTRTDD